MRGRYFGGGKIPFSIEFQMFIFRVSLKKSLDPGSALDASAAKSAETTTSVPRNQTGRDSY